MITLTSRQIKCPAAVLWLPGCAVYLDAIDADRAVLQVNAIAKFASDGIWQIEMVMNLYFFTLKETF
jgi:hypothetical protein